MADTFRILGVATGDYELRTILLGQQPRVDSVHMPPQGLSLTIPFAQVQMLDGCGNNVITVPGKP